MKKFFAVAFLLATMFFIGVQNNVVEARWQVVGIRTYLSIRESPSVYSRELARIPNGTILYDRGREANGFAAIEYQGIYGWVSFNYIRWIY